jgi:ABC-type uncharacterized transport system fused permease/ATPase subunit
MKKLPLVLLFTGFVFLFLSVDVTFTGAVVGTDIQIKNTLFFFSGLTFFLASLVLFVVDKSLESLVIPTGTLEADKKRVVIAMRSYTHTGEPKPYVLVSGEIHRDERGRPEKDLNNI